jgi:MFS family permease
MFFETGAVLTGRLRERATKFVFLACGITAAAWAPLVPYAKARVHANDQQFGLLLLCFGLGSIVTMPVMGRLAGRWGCRRLIHVTAATAAVALLGLSLAPQASLLALSLFVFGASIGSLDVVMNVQALLVDKENPEELMPTFHAFFSLGGIAGAASMSALLWINLSPQAAVAFILVCVSALLFFATPNLLTYGGEEPSGTSGFSWPVPSIMMLGILAFLAMLAEGSMTDWSAVYLVDRDGVLARESGLGFAAFSVAMTASRLIGTRVLQRFGRRSSVMGGAILAAAGYVAAVATRSPLMAITGFALIGLGLGNVVPVFFTVASESKGALGSNVSFVTTLGYAGVLAGPALIGFIVHATNFPAAFGSVACMLIFVGVASMSLTRSSKTSAHLRRP